MNRLTNMPANQSMKSSSTMLRSVPCAIDTLFSAIESAEKRFAALHERLNSVLPPPGPCGQGEEARDTPTNLTDLLTMACDRVSRLETWIAQTTEELQL